MRNSKNRKLIFLILITILVVIPFMSIGYSALATTLNIRGDVLSMYIKPRTVEFPEQIEEILDSESCMVRYEGNVTDQVGVTTDAHNVYFNKCSNKRNIIFGGFCWQMIRTTETGGIKVIYNGEPVNRTCESTRNDHKGIIGSDGSYETLNTAYKYGSSFTYNKTNSTFTLTDTITATWSDATYESLIGKYTCMSTSGTCTTMYNINGYKSNTQAFTSSYTIGDTNHSQIGTSTFNAFDESPAMIGYMFNTVYRYKYKQKTNANIKYGSTFTYSDVTGQYTLSGITKDFSNWEGYKELDDTHYTCWNESGVCSTIMYIYDSTNLGTYYIDLTAGKGVEDALDEMLFADDVNYYDSSVKGIIDAWYSQNLSSKTNRLENAIYCNSRNISIYNGWNPNGGRAYGSYNYLRFKNNERTTDISCLYETDQFSLNNNKAKLTYPISLLQDEEKYNINDYSLFRKNVDSWLISSPYFDVRSANVITISGVGNIIITNKSSESNGIRPVISLKNSVVFNSGTGSESDPWIVT